MPRQRSLQPRQRFPLESLLLDEKAGEPLYRQLETQIRSAILDGRLRPGERMPSTRQLAEDIGVARNTVKNAYNQLIIEGYLLTSVGSGTAVAHDLPEQLLHSPSGKRAPARTSATLPFSDAAKHMGAVEGWIAAEEHGPSRPLRAHAPASDAFPRQLWARLTTRRLRNISRNLLESGDPRGYRPLREVIAGYLGSVRGVACVPDQVIVTAGVQQAIELIATLLVDPGDKVCMEDPGYAPARPVFELRGAEVLSIPVDEEGLDVARLAATAPVAKLVYVTPSSQFPLGMTMSLPRRLALIEWAKQSGAVILEDDYNGEYRYAGRPLPALYGLAPPGQVLYSGSFSKLLFPALRIGYLVVPQDAVDRFAAARWLVDRHSPPLEQAVLTDFIEEGHFTRHVRRMRTLYAERQAALVEAARRDLDGVMDVPASDAGLHLIGWLSQAVSEATIVKAAAAAGVELMPTSWFGVRKAPQESVILGYAPFTPREIGRATRALAKTLEPLSIG